MQPLLHFNVDRLKEECAKPDFDLMLKRLLIGILFPCVFIITAMSIAYRFRWHIRWQYYSVRRHYRRKSLLEEGDYFENKYDAYVIFNEEEDTGFVFGELRPSLEDSVDANLSLYLNGRDDHPGMAKCDNVVDGMEMCHKVLLLVTPEFSKDEMCEFSLHMALVKGINNVVVLLKNYPDMASMTSTLRTLLKPNSEVPILEWPDEVSGQKLVLAELDELLSGTLPGNIHLREVN
jgi:hypothetical protein